MPGFDSSFRRGYFFFRSSHTSDLDIGNHRLPCQAPGIIGSALGLVAPVSISKHPHPLVKPVAECAVRVAYVTDGEVGHAVCWRCKRLADRYDSGTPGNETVNFPAATITEPILSSRITV